uniref:Uncharacterized protein n=1 Tax=Panagrolaimus sp. ES5 TaxID=591445 RepID=A0AC34GQT4_9BILA
MSKEVSYLRSPIHDMLVDRKPINDAFEILKNVWNMFQETYFESALESGNIETMKSVCLQLSSEQEKIKALTDDLKHA